LILKDKKQKLTLED